MRLALLVFIPALTLAQNPYEQMLAGHSAVHKRLETQARQITDSAIAEIDSRSTWEPLREQRTREMREMLGLLPFPQKTPLNIQITGTIDRPEYVIEKIAFESLPKVYVTANLYIPKDRPGPLPTVIYVCGHAINPYGAKTAYQRHGATLAKHGYVAMIIDPIQISETVGLHHGILNQEMYDWYSTGYTPAGVEVWNVIRALDYLETRPEVDPERFGITGRSGGAAMSWFSAAIEPRLKVVVPSMGISTYAANLTHNTQQYHCDCMFTINSRRHDMIHQGALIAPRPLFMVHGREDRLFPVPGFTEFEREVGELYESYGDRERFKNLVVEGKHSDSDQQRTEALKFFDQWLRKIPAREIDLTFEEVPAPELTVFGGAPPEDAQNYRVHEFFIPEPKPADYSELDAWKARRTELLNALKNDVFAHFPEEAVAPELRPVDDSPAGAEAIEFDSEPGVTINALLRTPDEATGPALLWVASDGEDWDSTRDTLRQINRVNALMVVYPRGIGLIPWTKKLWKEALRNSMHTGRTPDSMRLWDVLQAARTLRSKTDKPIAIGGAGTSAGLALYAAILDESIERTILVNPPTTHHDAPIFLNILRHTDLPEAAALLAPRPISFYGKVPEPYRWTQSIYRLYGAERDAAVTMSIEAALNGRSGHGFSSGL